MLILGFLYPAAALCGVEINSAAARVCSENIKLNGFSGRGRVIDGDIRRSRVLFGAGEFDLAVCNPPYFPKGSGKTAQDKARAAARSEEECSLAEIASAAAYLLRWGGRLNLVHRPERLSEVFCQMSEAGLEPKRLRFVMKDAESAPSLFLVEGRRGGKPGLNVEAPLILTSQDGGESDEVKRIYRRSC